MLRLLCPFTIIVLSPRVRQVDMEPSHQPRHTRSCVLLQTASALHPCRGLCSTATTHPSQRQPVFHLEWNILCVKGDWGGPTPAFLLGSLHTQMNLSRCSQGTQHSHWWKKTQKHRQHLPRPMCHQLSEQKLDQTQRFEKAEMSPRRQQKTMDTLSAVSFCTFHPPVSSIWTAYPETNLFLWIFKKHES